MCVTGYLSVSHSLKKGQGAGQKKGTFDARNSPKKGTYVRTDFSNVSEIKDFMSVKRLEKLLIEHRSLWVNKK